MGPESSAIFPFVKVIEACSVIEKSAGKTLTVTGCVLVFVSVNVNSIVSPA
jgi:hypothetical protein